MLAQAAFLTGIHKRVLHLSNFSTTATELLIFFPVKFPACRSCCCSGLLSAVCNSPGNDNPSRGGKVHLIGATHTQHEHPNNSQNTIRLKAHSKSPPRMAAAAAVQLGIADTQTKRNKRIAGNSKKLSQTD